MSNRLSITPVRITTLDAKGNETGISFHLKLANENSTILSDPLKREQLFDVEPAALVQLAYEMGDIAEAIVQEAEEYDNFVLIAGTEYSWNDIRPTDPTP